VKGLLKKYKLDGVKHANTPMALSTKLDLNPSGESASEKVYRGIIGSLLYVIASRRYIMFSACRCAWFKSVATKSHLTVVKRIFRYLL